MNEIIPYYKPLGLTPLQAIQKLKSENPDLTNTAITYAGRLDPMADGLLLLLSGDAITRKQSFLELPKTYEARILLGVETDSYDILGLTTSTNFTNISEEEIQRAVRSLLGTHQFPYPPYSSHPVEGKPLWQWARDNTLHEIPIPTRTMTVHTAQIHKTSSIPWKQVKEYILQTITTVTGDFRQMAITKQWEELPVNPEQQLQIVHITFTVTSGTYIRTLAHQLGKLLNTSATLYSLTRTRIGDYSMTK